MIMNARKTLPLRHKCVSYSQKTCSNSELKYRVLTRKLRVISRCSKLFYIILSKYFYFALRSCTAFACSALSHIARYAPSHRTNNYGTITQFKCKNNFEHLLKTRSLQQLEHPIRYRTCKTFHIFPNKAKTQQLAQSLNWKRNGRCGIKPCNVSERADYQQFQFCANQLGTNFNQLGTNFNKVGTNSNWLGTNFDNRGVKFYKVLFGAKTFGEPKTQMCINLNSFHLLRTEAINISDKGRYSDTDRRK